MKNLIKMSNHYGSFPTYVLAGGGNTSYKDEKELIVKASGFRLANIDESGFVKLDISKLDAMWHKTYASDEKVREKEVLEDLMQARLEGEHNRPSVESQLHALMPFRYVLHLHPTKVNGLTCGKEGKSWVEENLSKQTLWVEATKPGYILAMTCKEAIELHQKNHQVTPNVLLIENHGVFFAANTIEEMDGLVDQLFAKLNQAITHEINMINDDIAEELIEIHKQKLELLNPNAVIRFRRNQAIINILTSDEQYKKIQKSFTPDHVVYCRHEPLYTTIEQLEKRYLQYVQVNGFPPRIVFINTSGMFTLGETTKQAENAESLFLDQIQIAHYASFFGGSKPMSEEHIRFILDWEVEHYRIQVLNK
jgi:rhamnose utilization protein RhaD (predicted bifunctional aldolase and dehydrogenase)